MNMTENANLIISLEKIGFSGDQITSLILAIEGSISTDEFAERYKELEEANKK